MRIGRWSVGDVVSGRPWAHPTHPLFVHFPTALYPTALLFDLLGRDNSATVLLGIGLAGAGAAAVTGLVDWSGMVPGSTKRRAATRHLLWQSACQAAALAAFALRLTGPALPATLALAAAVTLLPVGNWFGGVLVYRMAMRVGGKPEPSPRRRRQSDGFAPSGRSASSE